MYQLITAVLAFMLIPILIKLKVKLGYSILITSVVLGVVSGIGFQAFSGAVLGVFTQMSSLNTILVVTMVSILGGVMKHYGILDKIVETMQLIIGSKRNIITIIPAMIGILIIPGGAILSAPFVKKIGGEINLSPARRAVINLVFRHIAMFLLPYSTSILIVTSIMPDISVPFLIGLNFFFVVGIIFTGYMMFLRDIDLGSRKAKGRNFENFKKLSIYTLPIYICVVITGITGIPFYFSMVASLIVVFILGDRKNFLLNSIKSINVSIVLTVTAVLIMQNIIMEMTEMLTIFNNIFAASTSMLSIIFVLLVTSTFFGFITGYQVAAMAITLPLIAQLNVSYEMMHIYVFIATACSFVGYFFSPLHLCQAFTTQIMGVSTIDLYKEYKFFAPSLVLITVVLALVYNFIF